MTQEQLEAAILDGGQRAERMVDDLLGSLAAREGRVMSQEAMLGEAFMFAAVSAAMHGMSRRVSGLSRVRAESRRSLEKQARVLGHRLISHVEFESVEPGDGDAQGPLGLE